MGSFLTNFRVFNSLFEEFAMAAEAHGAYDVAINPNEQRIRFYMALHETCIVANQLVWTVFFWNRLAASKHRQKAESFLYRFLLVPISFEVLLESGS